MIAAMKWFLIENGRPFIRDLWADSAASGLLAMSLIYCFAMLLVTLCTYWNKFIESLIISDDYYKHQNFLILYQATIKSEFTRFDYFAPHFCKRFHASVCHVISSYRRVDVGARSRSTPWYTRWWSARVIDKWKISVVAWVTPAWGIFEWRPIEIVSIARCGMSWCLCAFISVFQASSFSAASKHNVRQVLLKTLNWAEIEINMIIIHGYLSKPSF